MGNKINKILGSIRFWLLTVVMLGANAQLMLMSTWTLEGAMAILGVWLSTVVLIGSADSVATRIGGKVE